MAPEAEQPPAAQSADPAYHTMRKTATYAIIVGRKGEDFVAWCPTVGNTVAMDRTRNRAYRKMRQIVREYVRDSLANSELVPRDPIVSIKHLRLNLVELIMEGGLG